MGGTPLPTRVTIQPNGSYKLDILKPPVAYLLKQAAGIQRASMQPGRQVAGIVNLKHIYEIAKYKHTDNNFQHLSLKEVCIKVINSANRSGIQVVKHDLDPTELREFLNLRMKLEEEEKGEIAAKKAAKSMRAAKAAKKCIEHHR